MRINHFIKEDFITVHPFSGTDAIRELLMMHSALVVMAEDKFYGVLTMNDIAQNSKTLIIDCLTEKPLLDKETSTEKALQIMNKENVDVSPVSNKGVFTGLVYKSAIINYLTEYNTDLEDKIKERTEALESALATKDYLISVLAHDLRSPFNLIMGYTHLLQKGINKNEIETTSKYLQIVNSQVKKTYYLLKFPSF